MRRLQRIVMIPKLFSGYLIPFSGENDPQPLPPTTCDKTLANDFNNFFVEKNR